MKQNTYRISTTSSSLPRFACMFVLAMNVRAVQVAGIGV